jgi:hypothetical protein
LSSAGGARFFLHERDFFAWPSWLEACELASVQPTSPQSDSFSLIWP